VTGATSKPECVEQWRQAFDSSVTCLR